MSPYTFGVQGYGGAQLAAGRWPATCVQRPQLRYAIHALTGATASRQQALDRGKQSSRELHLGQRTTNNVASGVRTAVALVAAVALLGLFFTIGSIVIGLVVAGAGVYAVLSRLRARSASSILRQQGAAPSTSAKSAKTQTPLNFGRPLYPNTHPKVDQFFQSEKLESMRVAAPFFMRLFAPFLKKAVETASEGLLDVQTVRQEVDQLLGRNSAVHHLLGEGCRVEGVRAVRDSSINDARTLQVSSKLNLYVKVTFIARGTRGYADVIATVYGSVHEASIAHALLLGPSGQEVHLKGGAKGRGKERATTSRTSSMHTVDV